MRKFFLILAGACLLLLQGCSLSGARHRDVVNPPILFKSAGRYDISRVSSTDTALTVYARVSAFYDLDWTFGGPTYVRAATDSLPFRWGKVIHRLTGQTLPLQPDSAYAAMTFDGGSAVAAYDSVMMVFPPLPKGVTAFDLFQDQPWSNTRVFGVRTDGAAYEPTFTPSAPASLAALPDWQPRRGKAVLRGRIAGFSERRGMTTTYWGNNYSLTGDVTDIRHTVDDEGNYSFEMDLTHPTPLHVELPTGVAFSVLMMPGEVQEMDVDLPGRTACGGAAPDTLPLSAFTRRTGRLAELGDVDRRRAQWEWEANAYHPDSCQAHIDDDFATYAELTWQAHRRRLAEVAADGGLTPAQREYLVLVSEAVYLDKRRAFLSSKNFAAVPPDSAALEAFGRQMTDSDVHAAELTLPRSRKAPYVLFDDTHLDYLVANGLADAPAARWLAGLRRAREMAARLQLFRPVDDEAEWATIDTVYQPTLRALNDSVRAVLDEVKRGGSRFCPTPEGAPADYLSHIVAEHAGRVVLVDFWATWCGPCLAGMKGMADVKPGLMARGVDFVYVTDETSPAAAWSEQMNRHAGSHYRIPSADRRAMNIPDYDGGIPHYLIYDREGRFVRAFSGWGDSTKADIVSTLESLL